MATWTLDRRDRIAVLTFDRPPTQQMDFASMGELAGHLEALADDDGVSVVMLTGAGDGTFVAHADLEDLGRLAAGEDVEGDPMDFPRALGLLESIPQPTVAAVDGQAWGGGCEIALACTMRVGSPRAHLAQPEIVVGIIPGAGGTQRLQRIVGSGIGAELVLTGRPVDAEEAHRLGLLNAVLDDGDFVGAAVTWCEAMARHHRPAVLAAKRALVGGAGLPLADALQVEGQAFLDVLYDPEARRLMVETAERGGLGP